MIVFNNSLIVALQNLPGVGSRTIEKVFEDIEWYSYISEEELLEKLNSFRPKHTSKYNLLTINNLTDSLAKVLESQFHFSESGINFTSLYEKQYPSKLLNKENSPLVIYYKGDLAKAFNMPMIAVIGTRDATPHGIKVAERTGVLLAELGCCVISGLAIGCDTAAHLGCLSANGITAAILPSDIEFVQPKQNQKLADQIVDKGGFILSEYAPQSQIFKGNYIERDKIVANISDGIIIIESGIKSGTMHTANFGIKNGIPIACYKHPATYLGIPQSLGNKSLVESGNANFFSTRDDLVVFITGIMKNERTSSNISTKQLSFLTK